MKIAIAGATGLTGNLCLQQLLQNSEVSQVIAIGRRPTGVQNPKLKEVLLNGPEPAEPVVADAFICCLGTTIKKAGSKNAFQAIDLDLPLSLAHHLKQNGCTRAAIVSAMGADTCSAVFYSRTKGKMETRMQTIGFESLSFLRPSLIEGDRKEMRLGESVGSAVMKVLNPLLIGPLRHYQSIDADCIAKGLVKAIISKKAGVSVYLSDDIKKLGA